MELIDQGMVEVDGQIELSFSRPVDPARNSILVMGKKLKSEAPSPYRYILLHKPVGLLCTLSDEDSSLGRWLALKGLTGLKPAGRLDQESSGLLLLSDDGDFLQYISHPSTGPSKSYRVTASGYRSPLQKRALQEELKLLSFELKPLRQVELVCELNEGRNRQIRKSLQSVGLSVLELQRIKIGELVLENLVPEQWRELTPIELNKVLRYGNS